MESGPPLNLSTSVKVEDSVIKTLNTEANGRSISVKELIQQAERNQNFVLLQPLTNNENEVLTITGEPVKDTNTSQQENEYSSKETDSQDQHNEHDKAKTYECSYCPEKFYRASQLRLHEKTHVEEKIHYCEQCLETFPRLSLLLRHKQEHTKKTYECPECEIPLNNYNGFRMHMKKHKGEKRFKCTVCSMTFVQQSHLITHRRKHTGEKPYACHICNNHFKQVSHLTTHLRTHTKDRPYVCEFCNASFSQTGSLKRHRRSHTGEKPYQCKKCDSVFVEKRNLNRHLLSHSGIRPFKCDMCSASFTQYIDLQRHTFSHSGFKPYKCNVCEAAFSRKNNLKWHKLTHEGDTPHKCEICNVGFRIGRDLKNHKKYHVETKPYSCDLCKASFLQLSTLKRHINVHTGSKPYACDICKATFFEKSSLKRHIQRHDAVKPFPCDHCGSSFLDARTLKRHKIVVHKQGKYEDSEVKQTNIPPKQSGSKEISPALEEENSLHIYEPSFQKVHPGTETNMLIPTTIQDVSRESSEITTQSQSVTQVMTATNSDSVASIPTLVLSQPGQPPKTARPADNCQNHHSHVHTLLEGGYGQWQTWCFCDTPNIPVDSADPLTLPAPESHTLNIQENPQTLVPQHQGLNYQEISQSIPNATQTIQTSLTQPQDAQHHPIPDQHISGTNKVQPVSQNVYHNVSTSPSSEIQSVNGSYPHYNQVNAYNGEMTIVHSGQQAEETADTPLHHHANQNSQSSRDIPVIIEKSSYNSFPENTAIEPATYHFNQNFKRTGHDKEKLKSVDSLSLLDKNHLQAASAEPQRMECNGFQQPQIVMAETVKKESTSKTNSIIKEEINGFRTTQIVSVTQEQQCYRESPQTRHNIYNCESKDSKCAIEAEQSLLVAKDKEVSQVEVSTQPAVVTPQGVILNALPNNKDPATIPPYQLSVYEELSQPVTTTTKKEPVTLQYSMTVNNPATGDIQIQSEMFPAKTDETLPKQPIKKRRVPRNESEGKVLFVCTICSKTFINKNQLDLHQRKHTGEKPFLCGICNQCFSHNNSLTIHMRSHTGERPFTCAYCGATFTQKSNLGVHHRVHTGEKPFKCDVCETAFSQGSHLIAHKRIHNNDRPFVCSTCGQAFTQKSALKRHEMKHSGLKPHSCTVCNAKFSQKDDLKRHSVIHNSGSIKGKEKVTVTGKSLKAVYKRYGDKSPRKRISKTGEEEVEQEIKKEGNFAAESSEDVEKELAGEKPLEETPDRMPVKKSIIKHVPNKSVKSKPKDMPEPVRTSKRIKEAAEKKKFKREESDFITGDLEEIDRVEEIENQLVKVTRAGGWRKKDSQKTDSGGVVQSWCFCEVPHGPDEPHTHADNAKFDGDYPDSRSGPQLQQELSSNVLMNSENCREGVLQFTIPQLSHALVLQSDQVTLHSQQNSSENGAQDLSSENIVNPSGISQPQILNSNVNPTEASSLGTHFLTSSDQIVASQDVHNNPVIQDDGKAVYGTAQIISGQVLPASHFVTSEGTFFIEAGDIINNGTVVLNTSPGTFFFDLSGEGQLFNVPISTNVGHDPVIVAGSSSLEGSVTSTSTQAIYSTSAEPSTTSTISFSVRDSHPNTMMENSSSHSTSVLVNSEVANQSMLSSEHSSIANGGGEADNSAISEPTNTVQYAHIDGSNIGLFNTNISIDPAAALPANTTSAVVSAFKDTSFPSQEDKIQPIVINPSKCSVCGKEFAVKGSLKQHMRAMHPGLHFCTICFDAFTTKEHLITHKLQHKSSHPCPECFLQFPNRITLNQHRHKVHKVSGLSLAKKGNKNFECSRCKASFSQMSDLNRHLLGHTGEKPFKCKQCGACFTRKSSLNKHERIHTGEKPYSCRECGLSFAYRYQINRHRSTSMHKEEDQDNYTMPYVFN